MEREGEPPPLDPRPRLPVGIHGVHRARRWDAVVTAEAPELDAAGVDFVVLPDGTLLVDGDFPDGALDPLAAAVEEELEPPYRAEAVQKEDAVWAVAATKIDVVALDPALEGEELEYSVHGEERTLVLDGRPAFGPVAELDAVAGKRFDSFVVRGVRLDEELWEVRVEPL